MCSNATGSAWNRSIPRAPRGARCTSGSASSATPTRPPWPRRWPRSTPMDSATCSRPAEASRMRHHSGLRPDAEPPMIPAYAAQAAGAPLAPFAIERRAPGPRDVQIDILYCGVCHTDIHLARDEWGGALFPMVPGHEIIGRVSAVGAQAERYQVGDAVGVGCFVDSCRACPPCRAGDEQYCDEGMTATYNSRERSSGAPTYGGYSTRIVVDQDYVLRIPDGIPLDRAAPLLCAGVTTWSPLRHFGVVAGHRVAVMGLGGLGHMAVKLAVAMGAEVTVLSTSESKRADALALGAQDFATTGDGRAFKSHARQFDLIIDTVSAPHDYNACLGLLK